ncbi:MAG: hypothetical protein ACRC33_09800 [Gemmataceae bacterium]
MDIYGRGNNAYRWAGETDVWEAIGAVWKSCPIDDGRVVLRGFSMGGAGTWHLGLHHPGAWCAIGPGAGFTTTKGYVARLNVTPVQEKTLHIYDAVDYAENAFNVPVVAYSGEDDPQKKAADNIEASLRKIGIKMTHLVSPKTGHTTPPAYQKLLAAEYAKYTHSGVNRSPKTVRFITHTLRYCFCHWVYIDALDEHYTPARVEAEKLAPGFTVKTHNVRLLSLRYDGLESTKALKVVIDGQTLDAVPIAGEKDLRFVSLQKKAGKWAHWDRTIRLSEKLHRIQGPIDDAFMDSFLCVRGTGTPWNKAVDAYARADLDRFQREWSKYLRGDLRVKDDKDVTEDDIKNHALVLFGDPGSNSLLAKMLPKLPLTWTKDKLTWNGKTYDAATHVPAFIQPAPPNSSGPVRYLVVNSGHTFHEDAFQGTNALLYPRLGDHALLRLTDPEKPLAADVVAAGLFDEFWKFAPEKP